MSANGCTALLVIHADGFKDKKPLVRLLSARHEAMLQAHATEGSAGFSAESRLVSNVTNSVPLTVPS
jgi:hypothetical protein